MTCLRSAVLYLLLGCSVGAVCAEDWYRWRGPRQDGISTEECRFEWPDEKAPIAWTQSVGIGFSSIVVKDQRVYTIGHVADKDVVHCFDAKTGERIWEFGYAAALDDRDFEGGPISTPTVEDDRLYVFGRAGELFCFDAGSGKKLWEKQVAEHADLRLPGWGCSGSPLVAGDKLLLNLGQSGVAVDKLSGELIWSSQDRECGYATPFAFGSRAADGKPERVIFASGRSYVCVDIESGDQLWSVRWLTSFNCNAADPILHDGKMFLSSGYNRGAALFDLAGDEPHLIWKNKEMKNQIHSSLLFERHLYGIHGDMETGAELRCMDWKSGEVLWSVDDLRPGGLALAGGKLLLLTESGELWVAPASPQGWAPLAHAKVLDGKSWTAPVISGSMVYCRSIDGQLVCLDCRD